LDLRLHAEILRLGGRVKIHYTSRLSIGADTDEAGHAFQFEVGHLYRSEAGHRSDLMSATGGLLPQIEVDDV